MYAVALNRGMNINFAKADRTDMAVDDSWPSIQYAGSTSRQPAKDKCN